jgi:hypothetical protein
LFFGCIYPSARQCTYSPILGWSLIEGLLGIDIGSQLAERGIRNINLPVLKHFLWAVLDCGHCRRLSAVLDIE